MNIGAQPPWLAIVPCIVFSIMLPALLPMAIATEAIIFSTAALGCGFLLGVVGILSFGQSIFFGAGAYTCGIVLLHSSFGVLFGVAAAAIVGLALGLIVGMFSTKRHGIYGVMLTLAFSQMFFFIAYAAEWLTGGDNGLLNIPRPSIKFFGMEMLPLTQLGIYVLSSVLLLSAYMLLLVATRAPFGSVLIALRENEDRVKALGYNTWFYKTAAFGLSGLVTGAAGALFCVFLGVAPLSNIDLKMSERILVMTVLGGTGSLLGPVIGAVGYTILSSILSSAWDRWLLLLGVILIFIGGYARGGIWSLWEAAVAYARLKSEKNLLRAMLGKSCERTKNQVKHQADV